MGNAAKLKEPVVRWVLSKLFLSRGAKPAKSWQEQELAMSSAIDELHGRGVLQAAISNAIVRLMHDYTGRGPTKARTTVSGDLVVCVLADALTKGERSLVADGRPEAVLRMRKVFQDTMRASIVGEVERLTGRSAIAFMSDNHFDPDYAAEIIILEPEADELDSRNGDPDVGSKDGLYS
jgi:uncharacterized protein YbcI